MTIDEIYNSGNLSARSYHICKYNEIETIVGLKEYYLKYKTFGKLRRCGEKTNLELIQLLHDNFIDVFTGRSTVVRDNNNLITKIHELNKLQKQVINEFIKFSTLNLKVRGRNAITSYIGKPLIVENFSVRIFERNNFQVYKLRNTGVKTIPELEAYLRNIEDFIVKISEITDDNKLVNLNKNYLIRHIFSVKNVPDEILQNQSIIKLCEFLILENAFFKERYTMIFINAVKVFKDKSKTLDKIALEINLTRERVRQIRHICYEKIFYKIAFLKKIKDDLHKSYKIDVNDEFIIISDKKAEDINTICCTHFSKNFLSYILSVYLFDQFNIIGNLEDALINTQFHAKKRHNWKNIYLVKNELHGLINVNELIEDIDKRERKRKNKTYKFNFKKYLSRFSESDFIVSKKNKDFCKDIINEEFSGFLDIDEDIIFKRNTIVTAPEYTFKALEELGKPSTVEEILLKIKEIFPKFKTDVNKVRSSMRRKEGFTPVGRKSIFGLQKWEGRLKNFKGGTIRSIVKEYLDDYDIPLHISKITEYVLKYRPKTNEYSVMQNLKLDNSKMFDFFKSSTVGLSEKKYDSSFILLSSYTKENPVLNALLDFIKTNKRLPTASIKEERKLYSFFQYIKRKSYRNKNNELKGEEFRAVTNALKKYSSQKRLY